MKSMKRILSIIVLMTVTGAVFSQTQATNDIFVINHSKFGEEQFEIKEPKYNLYQTTTGIWEFVVCFETTKAIKRSKELETTLPDAAPHFEATALLSPDKIELTKGKLITQKEGYDFERDENLSNIYYFEHNSVEELEVEIVEVEKEWVIANVKGKAIINGSNGNNPDSDLSLRGTKFYLDKNRKRGIR